MFHKHKFNLKDNTLWCECGKVKTITCDHKWKTFSAEVIEIRGNEQRRKTLVCIKCGIFKSINTTTGEIN